jgi:hypothetical protein
MSSDIKEHEDFLAKSTSHKDLLFIACSHNMQLRDSTPKPLLEFRTNGDVFAFERKIEGDAEFVAAVKYIASGLAFNTMPQTCDLTLTVHWLNSTKQQWNFVFAINIFEITIIAELNDGEAAYKFNLDGDLVHCAALL